MDAKLAILGHFSAASAATGPFISVPLISPSVVTKTAALSSKDTLTPFSLRIGYFCLTIRHQKFVSLVQQGLFLLLLLQNHQLQQQVVSNAFLCILVT